MKRLDKLLVLGLVLVLLTGTLFAQSDDLQRANYSSWAVSNRAERVSFVAGVMAGAYYVAIMYMSENEGKGVAPIEHWVPKNITTGEMANLIERVYAKQEYRTIPTVAIICNWEYFADLLRRR
jgi:hypothetical protein